MAGPPQRRFLRVDAFRLALYAGLLVALLHLLHVASLSRGSEVPVVSRIETAVQDWALTRVRGPRPASGQVVIVAVDERSVQAEGKWPWSRAKLALLVDRLAAGGVRAVGFDMVWSEDDELPRRLAEVSRLAAAPGADPRVEAALAPIREAARGPDRRFPADVDPTEQLARAIERAGNVAVGFTFLSAGDAPPERLAAGVEKVRFFRTEPIQVRGPGGALRAAGGEPAFGLPFAGVLPPVDPVVEVADAGGFFEVFPDPDGVLRRYTVVARAGGAAFPSLGAAVLAKALSEGGVAARVVPVGSTPARLELVQVGDRIIDVDAAGRVWLDYRGRAADFPTWPATDVMNGRIPPEDMRGRVALVGTTAVGTWDQRVTPFDDIAPGVVTHATFVENALHGALLRRSPAVLLVELLLLVLLAVGLAWAFSRVRGAWAVPVLLATAAAWLGLAALAYLRFHAVVALGLPLVQMGAMFVAATSWRFVSEEREKRRARETFSRFLAPAIVDEVLGREGALKLGGEKRDLTVLFADIRGFTTLSEKLDPRVLIELLNEYLTPMTDIIVKDHQGTLDKYMGDAVMAFWGAPKAQPDHALRACRAALAMVDRLAQLRAGWRARGLPEIDIGVGVNSGPMSVGFVGSQDRFYNYTVLGDAVNLASRLEGANKEYGTRILVAQATWERVRGQVVARELDAVRVKGKQEPVVIHELLGVGPPAKGQAAFLSEFEWGLSAYKGQRWEEAMAHFRSAIAHSGGDACALMYLARCEAMRQQPPGPGWDGVYEMRHK